MSKKQKINFDKKDFKAAARYIKDNNPHILESMTVKDVKKIAYNLKDQLIGGNFDSISTYGFLLTKSIDANNIDIEIYVAPRFIK